MQNPAQFVFRQGFIYSIGNILTKLSGIILLPLYLKYINESEFGVVTLFETIFQFILILSSWGVKGGFMRWYHEMKHPGAKRQLFFTTWVFNFFTSILAVLLVGLLLSLFSYEIFRYELSADTIIWFLAGSFFRLLYDVPFHLMKLEQRASLQTGWNILNITLVLGCTFYFLEFREMGIKGIYLAQMVAHSLTFLALVPFIVMNMKPVFNIRVLKEMIKYGIPLAVSNILTIVLTLSDRHIINQYQNLGEVAGYSMAFKIANLLQMVVIASIITSYSNYYFKTLHDIKNSEFYGRFTRFFLLLITFGGLGIVLFSPEIMMVISSGSDFFQESVILVPILIAGLIFGGWRQLLTLPLNKHKKTKRISLILVTSALLNIALNFILVPEYGKMGATISTLMAQLFGMIWFIWEIKQLEGIHLQIKKSFILILIWGLIAFMGMQLFFLPLITGWFVKAGWLVLFAAMMFFTGLLGKKEIHMAGRFFKTGKITE